MDRSPSTAPILSSIFLNFVQPQTLLQLGVPSGKIPAQRQRPVDRVAGDSTTANGYNVLVDLPPLPKSFFDVKSPPVVVCIHALAITDDSGLDQEGVLRGALSGDFIEELAHLAEKEANNERLWIAYRRFDGHMTYQDVLTYTHICRRSYEDAFRIELADQRLNAAIST